MNRDCSVTVLIGLTSTRDKRAPAGSSPYSPRSLNIHTSSNRFLVIFYYYYFIIILLPMVVKIGLQSFSEKTFPEFRIKFPNIKRHNRYFDITRKLN